MIERVSYDHSSFQQPPLKFEAGTPMIAEIMGLGAAIDYIEQLGRKRIMAYETELVQSATQALQEIPGLRILGNAPNKGAIISFVIEGCHPLDVGSLLDLKGIALRTGHLCAQPAMQRFGISSSLRISFAPYNTAEDISYFVDCLRAVCGQLLQYSSSSI